MNKKSLKVLKAHRVWEEKFMQNKRLYISLGIAILLIGVAAFVAGKLFNAESVTSEQESHVTPAPELPTSIPALSGMLVERRDNTLIVQTVSFDPGSGWRLGDSNAPMDASSGPQVEVVVTRQTIIYHDDFEFEDTFIQQTVEETTLDYLDEQMLITVWGRKEGDRLVADIMLFQHLKE